ncbi:MAG: SH3 domain-containing protein [Clostridia bacterium]|nr:SH3 domain-containing protein [Clostridia bacterium]
MKKILAAVLIVIMTLSACAFAFAEQYAYVKTPTSDGTVYVRKVAGAGQPIAGVAKNGDTLLILKKGNTWHKVKVLRTGVSGYMYGVYIKFIDSGSSGGSSGGSTGGYTPDASVSDKDTVINKYGTVNSSDGYANLRWGPSTSYGVIAKEYNGASLWLLEQNGAWYRCTDASGRIGYVNRNLVSVGSTVSNTYGRTGVIRSSDGFASIRAGAGTYYSQLYTLNVGQSVTAYTSSGDWLKVSSPSSWTDAYVYRTLVRFYSRARATGSVNLRTGPSTAYSKLGVVANGSYVTLLATDGSFCRVDTGSAIGYVSHKYLSY